MQVENKRKGDANDNAIFFFSFFHQILKGPLTLSPLKLSSYAFLLGRTGLTEFSDTSE